MAAQLSMVIQNVDAEGGQFMARPLLRLEESNYSTVKIENRKLVLGLAQRKAAEDSRMIVRLKG